MCSVLSRVQMDWICFKYSFRIHICYSISQPSIMFSYKAQVDDNVEDDTVSLPHQQSFSSLKTDSDYIYQVSVSTFST